MTNFPPFPPVPPSPAHPCTSRHILQCTLFAFYPCSRSAICCIFLLAIALWFGAAFPWRSIPPLSRLKTKDISKNLHISMLGHVGQMHSRSLLWHVGGFESNWGGRYLDVEGPIIRRVCLRSMLVTFLASYSCGRRCLRWKMPFFGTGSCLDILCYRANQDMYAHGVPCMQAFSHGKYNITLHLSPRCRAFSVYV